MYDENEPIADDEFVLRRVHVSAYKEQITPPILRIAFQPNKNDTTGISVYRERFVKPADTLSGIDALKRASYLVVRLAVRDLRRFGLSVTPEPNSNGPPGHAVIPELNWQAFQVDMARLKRVQVELAALASNAIVHMPKATA